MVSSPRRTDISSLLKTAFRSAPGFEYSRITPVQPARNSPNIMPPRTTALKHGGGLMAGDTDHLEPRGMAAPVGHYSIRKLESERCDIAARIESIAVARNVISLHPTAIERLPARHRPRGRTVAAQPNRRGRRM